MYIAEVYTFTPGAAGEGTIEIPSTLRLEDFGTIINVSRGSVLYDPEEGSAGATTSYSSGSTILTLEQTTSYCLAGDKLQIVVLQGGGGEGPATDVIVTNSALNPVNISGSVTVINESGNSIPVNGPITDSQLRASALPLPIGAATSANQTTTNSSLSNIDTKTPALQSGAVPVGDNSSSLTVDGKAYQVQLDITRPSNTIAYPAGSVIGTGSGDDAILTLANIGPSGGFVIVQSIELVLGISVVPSGMTTFRLHFYSTKPATAAANASAFDVTSTDRGAYIGYIDMPSPIDLGSTCFTQVDYPGKLLKLAPSSTSLFMEMQTIGGFTPAANSEVYSLRVKTLEASL